MTRFSFVLGQIAGLIKTAALRLTFYTDERGEHFEALGQSSG